MLGKKLSVGFITADNSELGAVDLELGFLPAVLTSYSLESVGISAFEGCSRLSRLVIPASVTMIGNQAFDHCENLIVVVTSGSYAEQYCKDQGLVYVCDDE